MIPFLCILVLLAGAQAASCIFLRRLRAKGRASNRDLIVLRHLYRNAVFLCITAPTLTVLSFFAALLLDGIFSLWPAFAAAVIFALPFASLSHALSRRILVARINYHRKLTFSAMPDPPAPCQPQDTTISVSKP